MTSRKQSSSGGFLLTFLLSLQLFILIFLILFLIISLISFELSHSPPLSRECSIHKGYNAKGEYSTHTAMEQSSKIYPKENPESHFCHSFPIISLKSIFPADIPRKKILFIQKAKNKIDSLEQNTFLQQISSALQSHRASYKSCILYSSNIPQHHTDSNVLHRLG